MSSRMIQENNLTIWIGWDSFGQRFWSYAIDDTDAIILDLGLVKSDIDDIKTPQDIEKIILERLGIQISSDLLKDLEDDITFESDMRNDPHKTVQLFGFWN